MVVSPRRRTLSEDDAAGVGPEEDDHFRLWRDLEDDLPSAAKLGAFVAWKVRE